MSIINTRGSALCQSMVSILTFTLCLEAHQSALCGEPHPATAGHDASVPTKRKGMHLNEAVFISFTFTLNALI
jgi:hypothetical protein